MVGTKTNRTIIQNEDKETLVLKEETNLKGEKKRRREGGEPEDGKEGGGRIVE